MTLDELKGLAESQPYLYLTIPTQNLPRGNGIRLCGRSGPRGRICCVKETEDGFTTVAVFESQKILKFLMSG